MRIPKNIFLEAYKKIIEIREVELNILNTFKKNKIFSFLHLSIGQEAVAVGVSMALSKNDEFLGNHRSHSHFLAKTSNMKSMVREIFGDPRGCCKGYGGSMHLLDRKKNFLGSIPILGSAIPIASGMAMANKFMKKKNLMVVFIGDGASEEGAFYETINMAGLYKLPLLIVIEDNRYAVEADSRKRKVNKYNLKNIVKNGLNAFYDRVDGQDFKQIFLATKKIKSKILKENKIGILHVDCLRFSKHSGPNCDIKDQKANYRKKNEFNEISKRDPINLLEKDLISLNLKRDKIFNYKINTVNNINKEYSKVVNKIKFGKL